MKYYLNWKTLATMTSMAFQFIQFSLNIPDIDRNSDKSDDEHKEGDRLLLWKKQITNADLKPLILQKQDIINSL